MKKHILIILCCAALVGCSTTQQSTVIKSEGVIVVTVDAGMNAWRDYVNAGRAMPNQIVAVETAYNNYYTAQVAAKAALLEVVNNSSPNASANLTTVNASVIDAENQVLALLNQYLTPKQ